MAMVVVHKHEFGPVTGGFASSYHQPPINPTVLVRTAHRGPAAGAFPLLPRTADAWPSPSTTNEERVRSLCVRRLLNCGPCSFMNVPTFFEYENRRQRDEPLRHRCRRKKYARIRVFMARDCRVLLVRRRSSSRTVRWLQSSAFLSRNRASLRRYTPHSLLGTSANHSQLPSFLRQAWPYYPNHTHHTLTGHRNEHTMRSVYIRRAWSCGFFVHLQESACAAHRLAFLAIPGRQRPAQNPRRVARAWRTARSSTAQASETSLLSSPISFRHSRVEIISPYPTYPRFLVSLPLLDIPACVPCPQARSRDHHILDCDFATQPCTAFGRYATPQQRFKHAFLESGQSRRPRMILRLHPSPFAACATRDLSESTLASVAPRRASPGALRARHSASLADAETRTLAVANSNAWCQWASAAFADRKRRVLSNACGRSMGGERRLRAGVFWLLSFSVHSSAPMRASFARADVDAPLLDACDAPGCGTHTMGICMSGSSRRQRCPQLQIRRPQHRPQPLSSSRLPKSISKSLAVHRDVFRLRRRFDVRGGEGQSSSAGKTSLYAHRPQSVRIGKRASVEPKHSPSRHTPFAPSRWRPGIVLDRESGTRCLRACGFETAIAMDTNTTTILKSLYIGEIRGGTGGDGGKAENHGGDGGRGEGPAFKITASEVTINHQIATCTTYNKLIEQAVHMIDNQKFIDTLLKPYAVRLQILRTALENCSSTKDGTGTPNIAPTLDHLNSALQQGYEKLQNIHDTRSFEKNCIGDEITRDLEEIFTQLQLATETFQLDVNLAIQRQGQRTAINTEITRLRGLNPLFKAYHKGQDRATCIKNTRKDILDKILLWSKDTSEGAPNIYWLSGPAGTGKSTIAATVCKLLAENQDASRLAASFFCSRQNEAKHQERVIPTLVYQLSLLLSSFCYAVFNNQLDCNELAPKYHIQDLLVKPWKESIANQHNLPPLLVVIDALDELEDSDGSKFLTELLQQVAKNHHHLRLLKILVTSRSDPAIVNAAQGIPREATYYLHEVPMSTAEQDIRTYLRESLQGLPPDQLEQIATQTNGLFIYASTIIRMIIPNEQHPPAMDIQRKHLDHLCTSWPGESQRPIKRPATTIDSLYETVLQEVYAVAFSPDGLHAISGSGDNSLCVWNLSTGKQEQKLDGHSDWVTSVAFSPDGLRPISGSNDKSVRIWNLSTGKEQKLDGHSEAVTSVAFSPDGLHIISGSHDKSVCIWNLSTGREEQKLDGHSDWVTSVAFSPDGLHAISGSHDNTIHIWNVSTGKQEQKLDGHSHWVSSVAFSPDGLHVISGSRDKSVRIWNSSTGKEEQKLDGHRGPVTSVAFSLNGLRAISGSYDESARIWNLSTCNLKEEQKLDGHRGWASSVAFSPDGLHAICGSWDNIVRIWNLSTGKQEQKLYGHSDWVTSVAFSPDGLHVISGSRDKSVRIWNPSTGKEEQKLDGHSGLVTSVAFSPNGLCATSGSRDGSVRIWKLSTGKEEQKLEGHRDSG
uniref:NACHT domain-containing protein n=1 Tax=Mycena chlorophos TaxID=658473 RepID=A0ABQ0LDX5_MYCCL|nr:predicted protein [Mycena chlorophos]